jgi:ribosome biogenesis GTPase A
LRSFWLPEVENLTDNHTQLLVLGNKSDLVNKKAVKLEKENFESSLKTKKPVMVAEVSAK